jgi:hypothetical protein
MIGPVEYLVIEFPGNKFTGEIVPALSELVANGTIHVIDLAFLKKDADGQISAYELSELAHDEAAMFDALDGEIDNLLNEEDLAIFAEMMQPNSSVAAMVFENVWAARLKDAIQRANGRLVENARIPAEIVQAALVDSGIPEW